MMTLPHHKNSCGAGGLSGSGGGAASGGGCSSACTPGDSLTTLSTCMHENFGLRLTAPGEAPEEVMVSKPFCMVVTRLLTFTDNDSVAEFDLSYLHLRDSARTV